MCVVFFEGNEGAGATCIIIPHKESEREGESEGGREQVRMEGELSEGETRNYIHTGESQHFKLPSHSHTNQCELKDVSRSAV